MVQRFQMFEEKETQLFLSLVFYLLIELGFVVHYLGVRTF